MAQVLVIFGTNFSEYNLLILYIQFEMYASGFYYLKCQGIWQLKKGFLSGSPSSIEQS